MKAIERTTIPSMLEGTYKCLLMFIVIMAITLIMAKYYEERKVHHAWITGAVIYEVIMLINQLFVNVIPSTAQRSKMRYSEMSVQKTHRPCQSRILL